jgi:uncharacterized protein (TIGR00369 family)
MPIKTGRVVAVSDFVCRNPNYDADAQAMFAAQAFMQNLKGALTISELGHAQITAPFLESSSQQHGFFHGGVVGALADNAMGCSAFTLFEPGDHILTVEYKVNLLAPADGDIILAKGWVVKSGKTLTVTQGEIFVEKNGNRKLCATATGTMMRMTKS